MSARVGLVAVRQSGVEEFVSAFPMLEACEPATGNGWTWASFSLFGVSGLAGPRADEALAKLGRPGIQVWTEDGALWYLAIHVPGKRPFRHVHWFRYNGVASGEEEVERGATLRKYLEEYEADLLPDYRYAGPLPEGPIRAAMAAYLKLRAGGISDALAACGAAHDRNAVRDVITGASVTETEWGWDVGNLPRFLDAIGLGEVFSDWKEEIESERRAEAEAEAAAEASEEAGPEDLAEPILRRLGVAPPAAVRGGPVEAPLASLWLLPWACHDEVEIALVVRPARAAKIRWPKADGLSVLERDGEIRIGHPWCSVWMRDRLFEKLQAALTGLPDGSVVEMVSASLPDSDDGAAVAAGDMRFRGVIERGRWKVTHARPETGARDLEAALEIFEWVHGRGAFTAKSATEARAIVELGVRGDYFGDEKKDLPVVSGREIRVRSSQWRHYVAMAAFRTRFAEGPWDTTSSQQADEKLSTEMDELIANIGAKFSQALAAPRGAELVYQGARSAFRRASMSELRTRGGLADLLRAIYPSRDLEPTLDLQAAVRLVDEAMAKCGLVPLGDMVCELFGEVVIRGYASGNGDTHGLLYAGTTGQFAYEFSTLFTDGSSQTTSINPGADRPDIASRHTHVPGASVEVLFEKHRDAIARLARGAVKPADHARDLAALAARIDEFLVRTAA